MRLKKWLYIGVGSVGLGIGALGAVLPVLPSFPFLLLAAVCFGKSSERLNTWFKGTQLYKRNLETYVKRRGMTRAVKRRIMLTVSAIFAVSLFFMWHIPAMRIVLGAVWLGHMLYFTFRVKTLEPEAVEVADAQ